MKTRPITLTDYRRLGKRRCPNPEHANSVGFARRTMRAELAKIANSQSVSQWLLARRKSLPTGKPKPENVRVFALIGHELPEWDYGRKKNLESPVPTTEETHLHTHDHGRYSSRCTYHHLTYQLRVESWGAVISERILYYRIKDITGLHSGFLRAPRGFRWAIDQHGIGLFARDGRGDFHPVAHDVLTMTAAEMARRARGNDALRRQVAKQQAQARREEEQMLRLAPLVGVTLQDARACGYCLAGTSGFAKDNGITDDVTVPLRTIPASLLLRLSDERAHRVALRAIRRATEVTI